MASTDPQLDGQECPSVDECLTRLTEILRAIGVEEFSYTDNTHIHVINRDKPVDQKLVSGFCRLVQQLRDMTGVVK